MKETEKMTMEEKVQYYKNIVLEREEKILKLKEELEIKRATINFLSNLKLNSASMTIHHSK